MNRYRHFIRFIPRQLVAGCSALLAIALLIDAQVLPSFGGKRNSGEACQEVVQPQAKLSKAQLARLLTVSEGDRQQKVRDILKQPYCKLANLQIRADTPAQREAYPLEFEDHTWLIVLYEGEQYAGYRINVR